MRLIIIFLFFLSKLTTKNIIKDIAIYNFYNQKCALIEILYTL